MADIEGAQKVCGTKRGLFELCIFKLMANNCSKYDTLKTKKKVKFLKYQERQIFSKQKHLRLHIVCQP